jgi:hypothetical protein
LSERVDNISNGDEMNEDNDGSKITGIGITSRPGILPIVVVAIVIMAAVGGIFAYNEFLKPEPALVTATIKIDFGNGTVLSEEIGSDNNTALGLLRTFVGAENVQDSGGFVTAVNGIQTVDDVSGLEGTEARYWMYYVNGEMPMESAALKMIADGDVVEFKFETSPW